MKRVLVGEIKITGPLHISDPGYEDQKSGLGVKVKPGVYEVYSVIGRLPSSHKLDLRVAQVELVKKGVGVKQYEALGSVSVDSGNVGIFLADQYQKNLSTPRSLENTREYSVRELYREDYKKNQDYRRALKLKRKHPLYQKLTKVMPSKQLTRFLEVELALTKTGMKRYGDILRSGIYPNYFRLERTKSFYELMCDLSKAKYGTGLLEDYGICAQTAFGDGQAKVFITHNKVGEAVGLGLKFCSLKDLV